MSKQPETALADVILVYTDAKKKQLKFVQDSDQIDELFPFLYLGDSDAALPNNLHKHITHILNVTKELKCPNLDGVKTCQIPIQDDLSSNLAEHIPTIIEFISQCLKKRGCILVHCYSGISRSPSMVAAFIMHHFKLDVENSLKYIRKRRKEICPNSGFVSQLYEFEKSLAQQGDSSSAEAKKESKDCAL